MISYKTNIIDLLEPCAEEIANLRGVTEEVGSHLSGGLGRLSFGHSSSAKSISIGANYAELKAIGDAKFETPDDLSDDLFTNPDPAKVKAALEVYDRVTFNELHPEIQRVFAAAKVLAHKAIRLVNEKVSPNRAVGDFTCRAGYVDWDDAQSVTQDWMALHPGAEHAPLVHHRVNFGDNVAPTRILAATLDIDQSKNEEEVQRRARAALRGKRASIEEVPDGTVTSILENTVWSTVFRNPGWHFHFDLEPRLLPALLPGPSGLQ